MAVQRFVEEGTEEHNVIAARLISGMGDFYNDTTIVSIHKYSSQENIKKAFGEYTEAVARKNDGNVNERFGFYGGSKAEIESIFSRGFGNRDISRFGTDDNSHGIGIHLVHSRFSLVAASDAVPEEDGLRYLLFCKIILGKSEVIRSGSKQSSPRSSEFDSGVDDLDRPLYYVIWPRDMNSRILPCYMITFRSPRLRGPVGIGRSNWLRQ